MARFSRLISSAGRKWASLGASIVSRAPLAAGTQAAQSRQNSWLLSMLLGAGAAGCVGITVSSNLERASGPTPFLPGIATAPKEQDLWSRWAQIKGFLGSWRRRGPESSAAPLPTDKLRCHLPAGGYDPQRYRPVVLVSCGSFNPPTFLHLRMLELATQMMAKAGFDVQGCYLSPVNDAYWKASLAPGRHRLAMCQLAAADSDSIMVDSWEVEQRQYTRTLHVLQHVQDELARQFQAGYGATPVDEDPMSGGSCPPVVPRVMLVCGADVLESMADPAMWRQDLLEKLLAEHGVVCISRHGAETARVLDRQGSLLHTYRSNVAIIQDPVPNEVSSSRVRHELEQGHSVRYLVPDGVIDYIHQQELYKSGASAAARPRVLRGLGPQVDADQEP